jgi:small subunit ribosomal protein S17
MERNLRPSYIGKVVSDKMDKTIVVLIETHKKHPKYKKRVKYATKLVAHDEKNEAVNGDMVLIRGTRPLSKTKYFTLVSITKKARGEEIQLKDEVVSDDAAEVVAEVINEETTPSGEAKEE